MEKALNDTADRGSSESTPAVRERLVYVLPDEARPSGDEAVSLIGLWSIVWRGKWWVGGIAATFAAMSIVYVLMQMDWYRAEVLLAPANERSGVAQGLAGQLGGLATLAGLNMGGSNNVESIAVLKSRDFIRSFIEDRDLIRTLLPNYDSAVAAASLEEGAAEAPDIRDAVWYFHENILGIEEDPTTELVTLRVEWTDPEVAAEWANELVGRLNRHMRDKALKEAETNVAFLQQELADTRLVTLEQTIGRLLESELQRLMLARGSEEFAFRILDSAQVPKAPFRPRETLTVVLTTTFGGALGALIVLLVHGIRRTRTDNAAIKESGQVG